MIEQNVKKLLEEVPEVNPYGERVTVVAAVKLQTAADIDRAIAAGITDIGDNHVQEFREKYAEICGGARRHFIGHLQTNKIKYLLGKVHLYHSIDSLRLAEALSQKSAAAGVVSPILVQINIGCEESKGGFPWEEGEQAYAKIRALPALNVRGLMAMLPLSQDERRLICLARQMRALYDTIKAYDKNCTCLSMGMSNDWRLCVDAGSNMIRVGTSIFGARNYAK